MNTTSWTKSFFFLFWKATSCAVVPSQMKDKGNRWVVASVITDIDIQSGRLSKKRADPNKTNITF